MERDRCRESHIDEVRLVPLALPTSDKYVSHGFYRVCFPQLTRGLVQNSGRCEPKRGGFACPLLRSSSDFIL